MRIKKNKIQQSLKLCLLMMVGVVVVSCGGTGDDSQQASPYSVDNQGNVVASSDSSAVYGALPFSPDSAGERSVAEYGYTAVRLVADERLSHPEHLLHRDSCFIVMSKKDYYLYVYEAQDTDTVLLARYDCCFGLQKGCKKRSGDMKTPHTTMDKPYHVTQMADASGWTHDFGDGRGNILCYGHWFLRLGGTGHSGIGIHGSTNNEASVPGRASEGCIRLRDADIIDLHDHYAHLGMKVVIKGEDVDDLPFEVRAMRRQQVSRKRHLRPSSLTNSKD